MCAVQLTANGNERVNLPKSELVEMYVSYRFFGTAEVAEEATHRKKQIQPFRFNF